MERQTTRLVFENLQGQVVRILNWSGQEATLIHRLDTKRLELCEDLEELHQEDIGYVVLDSILPEKLAGSGVKIAGFGHIRLAKDEDQFIENPEIEEENSRGWWCALAVVSVAAFVVMTTLLNVEIAEKEIKEELRQHVVKVIKRRPPKKVTVPAGKIFDSRTAKTQPTKVKKRSVRRMGALAVLGSLRRGKRKGGVNLGQVKVSRGPGLGGTQGSGGVQTSLYGKGIISAPVGVGGNIKGGGGYGTKGKGGGRAGYGQLSLIGSSGTDLIPLGKEAIINGGLDKDLIARVIQKNMGQIRFCYERGLQSDPKLTGRVAVNFVIGGNGRVKLADLENTTLHSKLVEDCILLRLKSWKFPLPEGGLDVRVSYPFMLKRHGKG